MKKKNLISATNKGDLEEVKRLLAAGADVNQKSDCGGGFTPLIIAAMKGHREIVNILMEEKSIEVNIQDKGYGYTALIWASDRGYSEIVKDILTHSTCSHVDINLQDKQEYTALIRASLAGHKEIVEELLIAGADTSIRDKKGYNNNALEWAEEYGQLEIVEILNKHVDINVQARDKSTALINASGQKDAAVVKAILSKGKRPKAPLRIVSHISSAAAVIAVTVSATFLAAFEFNRRRLQEIKVATNKCMTYLVAKSGNQMDRRPAEIDESKRKCLDFIEDEK